MLPNERKHATSTARCSFCGDDNPEHSDPKQSKSSDKSICSFNHTENDTVIQSTQTQSNNTHDNVNMVTFEPFTADSVLPTPMSDLMLIITRKRPER